jgi:hypothetical protein
LRIYDAETGELLQTFANEQGAGGILASDAEGKHLISAQGEDPEAKAFKFARVWRLSAE